MQIVMRTVTIKRLNYASFCIMSGISWICVILHLIIFAAN